MGGSNDTTKRRSWRISFHRSPKPQPSSTPSEFICPITKSLMSDPVIVSSGQTFERTAIQVCKDLNFTPQLPNEPTPNFTSAIIPNRNIRSAIANWCKSNRVSPPAPPDYYQVESLVKALINQNRTASQIGSTTGFPSDEMELLKGVADMRPQVGLFTHAATEMNFRQEKGADFYSSSEESVVISQSPGSSTPLPFATKPACLLFQSSSSSDLIVEEQEEKGLSNNEIVSEGLDQGRERPEHIEETEEEGFLRKLLSLEVFEIEEGVIGLRKVTKSSEEARVTFCSLRLLKALKPLVVSRYAVVQVNAVAALVNMSLDKCNKLKIVRAGFVPLLIDLLKGGSPEAQELAAGAVFSLALEEDNKTAIGALGALQPLLHVLRADSERTRCDAALALYHLSLVPSNRVKMVKLGAVSTLLTLLRGKDMAGRVVLVLCNLAACAEGKSAMLDGNAVGILVEMLRENVFDSEATEANLVAALYSLSYGSLRFRGLAKEAGAVEVLRKVEERGSERAKEKAKRILQMMRGGGGDGDDDETGESGGGLTRGMYRVGVSGGGKNVSTMF